jgi:hypothetical protein
MATFALLNNSDYQFQTIAALSTAFTTLGDSTISEDGTSVNIQSSAGLILLSNMDPTLYQAATVTISAAGSLDLTGTVQSDGATLSFRGLGHADAPFQGTFSLSADKTITLKRALFAGLSCKAAQSGSSLTLKWLGAADSAASNSLLADAYIADEDTTTHPWAFTVNNYDNITDPQNPTYASLGSLVGTMAKGTGITTVGALAISTDLTAVTNQLQIGYVTGTADADIGLVCSTMGAGTKLDITGVILPASYGVTAAGTGNAGGLVGSMAAGAVLSSTATGGIAVCASISAGGTGNAGGLAGSMAADATDGAANISAAGLSASSCSVTAAGAAASAGGIAGSLTNTGSANACITTTGNISVTGSTIAGGSTGGAGGLFGTATDAVLSLNSGNGTATVSGCTVGTAQSAGGLIGKYTYTGAMAGALGGTSLPVNSKFVVTSSTAVCPADSGMGGGLFGLLTNSSTAGAAFTMDYTGITAVPVSVSFTGGSAGSAQLGGLIGQYSAGALANTLSITQNSDNTYNAVESTLNTTSAPANYGGLVGRVYSSAYVKVDGAHIKATTTIKAASFGGLVGYVWNNSSGTQNLLDFQDVTVWAQNFSANSYGGGIVGFLDYNAAIRLSGYTDLTDAWPASAGAGGYGQLIGRQDTYLVYAEAGWEFKRSSTAQRVDDIGGGNNSYGEVIRLNDTDLKSGTDLTDSSTILKFDTAAHTLTLAARDYTNEISLGSKADFALLAITIQSNGFYYADANYKFSAKSGGGGNYLAQNANKTINITANIDMSDTGIYGLTRDTWSQYFSGTLNGNGHTLTLPVGQIYGTRGGSAAAGTGSGQMYRHQFLGLFGRAQNVMINNIIFDGAFNYGADADVYAGAAVGYSYGNTAVLTSVTTKAAITYDGTSTGYTGGLIGKSDNATSLTVTGCTGQASLTYTATGNTYLGGLVGYLTNRSGLALDFHTTGNVLSGSISTTGAVTNACVGGLIAEINGGDAANPTALDLTGLQVLGQTVTVASATGECGGLLGHQWKYTDVTLSNVTINKNSSNVNAALSLAGSAGFGGLVYRASGHWIIKKDTTTSIGLSVKNTAFAHTGTASGWDGLLVCSGRSADNKGLYLEVDSSDAYVLDSTATVTKESNNNLDELVAYTVKDSSGSNYSGVVSLATENHALIDQNDVCNTYQNQTQNATGSAAWTINPNTRYYYNLDTICNGVDLTDGTVDTANELMAWSLVHYAATNLTTCFAPGGTAASYAINGTFGLSGYSYYPVSAEDTPTVTGTITFDNEGIADAEAVSGGGTDTVDRSPNSTDSKNHSQHYLMHAGLFLQVKGNLTVTSLTLAGSVGYWSGHSGALIADAAKAGTEAANTDLIINGLTLKDLYITDLPTGDYYALAINRIERYRTVNITNVATLAETGGFYASRASGTYAASSLIGIAGGDSAQRVIVTFSQMKLDARKVAAAGTAVSAYGNTTYTVFRNATFLEYFKYKAGSGSSGTYNFNLAEDWTDTSTHVQNVTYGKEISESVRNAGEQHWYYDQDTLCVNPTVYPTTAQPSFSTDYLPYVTDTRETSSDTTYHELDVNVKLGNLASGCGTYGDPYVILSAKQFSTLSAFLASGSSSGLQDWVVCVNTAFTIPTYCDKTASAHVWYRADGSGSWVSGSYSSSTFTPDSATTKTDADMAGYLRGAYYQVQQDAALTLANTFEGLGSSTYPFTGVVVGVKNGSACPTINIKGNKKSQFGFIKVSYGSVVKDLNINYLSSDSSTPVTVDASSNTKNAYFGGVLGDVYGGDNIVDNVEVTYSGTTLTLSGTYARYAAVGGYVGIAEAGGVIFKNMAGKAGLTSVKNGTTQLYPANEADAATNPSTYFYANPFVGRVLDGFAFDATAGETLANTNKNYYINTLDTTNKTTDLAFSTTGSSGNFRGTIQVGSAQGLLILSAITNSGAGSASGTAPTGAYDSDSPAYLSGKARNADYSKVGNLSSSGDTEFASAKKDDANDGKQTPYLITNYTSGNSWLRAVTGRSTRYSLAFTKGSTPVTTLDMSGYKNGFRGLGGRYTTNANATNVDRNLIYLCTVGNSSATAITLAMDVKEYTSDASGRNAVGIGLINRLMQDNKFAAKNKIQYLTLSGSVAFASYDSSTGSQTSTTSQIGVGGLAGITAPRDILNRTDAIYPFNNIVLENLTVSGSKYAGGLLGWSSNANANNGLYSYFPVKLDSCSFSGSTVRAETGTSGSCAGGLIGYMGNSGSSTYSASLEMVSCTGSGGTIEASSEAGGLVGKVEAPTFTCTSCTVSAAAGETLSASGGNVGGVAGTVSSTTTTLGSDTVSAGAADAVVTFSGTRNVGGLIGALSNYSGTTAATSCNVNAGETSGKMILSGTSSGSMVGGLFGTLSGTGNTAASCVVGSSTAHRLLCHSVNQWWSFAGGIAGNATALAVDKATVQNVDVFAFYAGGVFGETSSQPCSAANTEILNCNVLSSASGGASGGAVGQLNTALSGSNLLWNDNQTGYYLGSGTSPTVITNDAWISTGSDLFTTATVGLKASSGYVKYNACTFDGTTDYSGCGVWIGAAGTRSVQLSGVSRQASSGFSAVPMWDTGDKKDTYTGYIVYADYQGTAQKTGANTTGASSPYVTVNPSSGVSAGTTLLTGDGACFTTGTTTAVATQIKADYGNRATNKNANVVYAANADWENYASYVTETANTYQDQQTGYTGTNFPVLVVDKTKRAEVTAEITAYLNAVTNGGYARYRDASGVTLSPVLSTYQWDSSSGKFSVPSGVTTSLAWDGTDKQYYVQQDQYDNTKNQFTLLTLTFDDAYTMYVPIIVQKLVEIDTTITLLNGTQFRAADFSGKTAKILAPYGEQFTGELTFTYTYDWVNELANGSKFNWGYEKTLSTGDSPLPAGTRLTLVDPQNKDKVYTQTLSAASGTIKMTDFAASDGTSWTPTSLNAVLNLTASTAEEGAWVQETDSSKITVTDKDGIGYRKYDSTTDSSKQRYTLSMPTDAGSGKEIAPAEHYYLVAETPTATALGADATTRTMQFKLDKAASSATGSRPNKIVPQTNNDANTCYINAGITQSLNNAQDETGYTEMTLAGAEPTQNKITMTLKDTLTFTQGYRNYLSSSDTRYLDFAVAPQQRANGSDTATAAPFASPVGISCTFTILDKDGETVDFSNLGVTGISGTSYTDTFTLDTNDSELILPFAKTHTDTAFNIVPLLMSGKSAAVGTGDEAVISYTIQAEITMDFANTNALELFPQTTLTNSVPGNYTQFVPSTRLGINADTMLSGAAQTISPLHGYYRKQNATTKLQYNATTLSQLGINPNDLTKQETENGYSVIESEAVYDVSTLSTDTLGSADSLVCTLTLQQRTGDETTYSDAAVGTYWNSVTGPDATSQTTGYTWTAAKGDGTYGGLYDKDKKQFKLPFTLNVNNSIESASGIYANYKVVLTVALKSGNTTIDDANTQGRTDYFKYTLAKVSTKLLTAS